MNRTESAEPSPAVSPEPAVAPVETEWWLRALFPHERMIPSADEMVSAEARAEAEECAARWQAAAMLDDAAFGARLALAGLERDGFVRMLAAERVRVRPEAAGDSVRWREAVEAVRAGTHDGEPIPPISLEADDAEGGFPFPLFIDPFLRLALAHVRSQVALGDAVMGGFVRALARRLGPQCLPMLTLELNVARLMGLLEGETPEERFAFFARGHLARREVRNALLDEYATLARLMATTALNWADAVVEFAARLEADRAALANAFNGGRALGALADVHAGGSDAHRGGRGVVVAEFEGGLRLVYKPTPLAAGARFQRFLARVNALGLAHPHRTLTLVDRGEHGWMEFVPAAPCADGEAVRRFYRRQGSLAAILHLLRATDFHFENLIAAGEHPVPVDLESLFHHDLPVPGAETGGSAAEEAQRFLRHSVLRSAILPVVMRGRDGRLAADVSAVGGEGGQEAATRGTALEAAATDRMQVVEGRVLTRGGQNLPSLDGASVGVGAYVEEVVAGFEETYDRLAAHRGVLAEEIAAFAGDEVRNLLRMTRHYALFVREGHHPDHLRDGLDRAELLDRLWAESTVRPELARLAASEAADLLDDDVPAFSARPGERHLWDARGRRIDDFFPAPSLDGALDQLAAMGEGEKRRQAFLVRSSLASVVVPSPCAPVAGTGPVTEEDERAMLDAAVAVGEHLAATAIHGREGDATWVALNVEPDANAPDSSRLTLAPTGPHLYEGQAGIALFLATLGHATGRGDFRALAAAALASARGEWRRLGGVPAPSGAFLGRASLPYVLVHLARLWNEPALLDEALAALPAIERGVAADRELDLIGGAAGCAVALLRLHGATGDAGALRVARLCGEHLLRAAVETDGGRAWPGSSGLPGAGMSHGAAGIAWALLELAGATGDERFADAARRGIAWERAAFDPALGGWSHRRVAWCHGAASIALARALSAPLLGEDDPQLVDEIRRGADAILAQGPTADPCLCHGILGNADLLLAAASALGEPAWRETARAWGAAVARDVLEVAGRRAFPQYVRSTGLMAGVAGLGMGLLRLRAPGEVPSVLVLEGPR